MVGAVFWPRRPLYFYIGRPRALGSIGTVFRRAVFRSARTASAPCFSIYDLLALWGPAGPRLPEGGGWGGVEVWPRRPSFFNLILLAPWAPIGAPVVGRSAFWSVRYDGRDGPNFSIYGPWRPGDQSAPIFAESGIYAGAEICLHRPLFSNLGPPGALAVYRPRFPEGGILVGAAFPSLTARYFRIRVPAALRVYRSRFPGRCILVGAVFRQRRPQIIRPSDSAHPGFFRRPFPQKGKRFPAWRGVFRSGGRCRKASRPGGRFPARGVTRPCDPARPAFYRPPFPKRGGASGQVGRLPVGGSMPKSSPVGRGVSRSVGSFPQSGPMRKRITRRVSVPRAGCLRTFPPNR